MKFQVLEEQKAGRLARHFQKTSSKVRSRRRCVAISCSNLGTAAESTSISSIWSASKSKSYLTGDWITNDELYLVFHLSNQLLMLGSVHHLTPANRKSAKDKMDVVSAKTRTHRQTLLEERKRGAQREMYKLILIPVREIGI